MGIEKIGMKAGREICEVGLKKLGQLNPKAVEIQKITELAQLVSKEGANAIKSIAEADAILAKRLGL